LRHRPGHRRQRCCRNYFQFVGSRRSNPRIACRERNPVKPCSLDCYSFTGSAVLQYAGYMRKFARPFLGLTLIASCG
jgi:hypothetical protein